MKTSELVANQLAMKLKLENQLKPELRRLFKQMANDVKVVWLTTGHLPSLNSFHLEITSLLRSHYRRVYKKFKKEFSKGIKKTVPYREVKQFAEGFFEEENQNQNFLFPEVPLSVILGALVFAEQDVHTYIRNHSSEQASHIINTTEKDLRSDFGKTLLTSNASDTTGLAEESINRFVTNIDNRVDTIAATETQTPSEAMKLIEITALVAILGGSLAEDGSLRPGVVIKTWNTVVDGFARQSHVRANGQTVLNNEPFVVDGQRLMSPGNGSLGASLKNIINCRCIATYSVLPFGNIPVNTVLQ